jgi:hypothetical protein
MLRVAAEFLFCVQQSIYSTGAIEVQGFKSPKVQGKEKYQESAKGMAVLTGAKGGLEL